MLGDIFICFSLYEIVLVSLLPPLLMLNPLQGVFRPQGLQLWYTVEDFYNIIG